MTVLRPPRRRDTHLWLAAAVCVLGLLLVAAELVVYLSHRPVHYRGQMASVELWQYLTQGTSTLVVGFLVVTRPAARRIGWFMLAQAFAFAVAALISTSLRFASAGTWPVHVAVYSEYALWEVPRLAFTMFPLFFPTGRLPGRWARWLVAVLTAAVLAGELSHLLGQRWWHPGSVEFPNALYLPWWPPVAAAVRPWLRLVTWTAVLLAALSPLSGWRGFDRLRRRQIAIVMPVYTLLLIEEAVRDLVYWSGWVAAAKLALGVLVPAVIGYTVINTRLYELDRASRRIATAVVPLLLLAVVYAAAAYVMAAVLPDGGSGIAAVLAVLAALVGLMLRPASQWLLRRVDRMLYGDRAEPYQLARRLAARIRDGAGGAEVPRAVCQVAVSALRLPGAALDATDGFRTRRLAAVGVLSPAASLETVDLRYHGRVVGHLRAMPRSGQSGLDDLDRAALQPLADLAAPVVSTGLLQQELATSRARLVRVREEERNRLGRDVHDGVGPSLAAIRLQIDAAIALLPPEAVSGTLLAGVSRELHDIVSEMRRITDDLRPPALERLGLAGALVDLAARLSTPTLPIRVDLTGTLPPVSPPVELAAYRIVAEAVANALRHSSATAVVVGVAADGDVLTVRVADDGTGIARREPRAGIGLSSMAQRARDVGGTCEVQTSGAGTTVIARLPARSVEPTLAEP